MSKLTVSKLIVKKIEEWKVKDVPIFQGGAITQVLGEIGNSKKINYYCPNHEQALAMAVDAYSRLRGFGVGLVTSGPGATNLLTGVACSYYDSIPCLFFTGQVGQFHITGSRKVRQRGFQETDVISIFKPITKFCYQLKNANEVSYILDKAYYLATTGRPGPVLIDVPFNIQKQLVDLKTQKKFKNIIKTQKINNFQIIKSILKKSNKPILIAGGGVRISKTISDFLRLVEDHKLPFLTTWPAQDITHSNNKYYFGSLGRHANLSANKVLENSDLIFCLGVRFSPKIIGKNFGNKKKVIALDIDKNELDEGLFTPDLKINCDLREFFKKIKKNKIKKNYFKKSDEWIKRCKSIKKKYFIQNVEFKGKDKKNYVNPYNFLNKISNLVDDNAILLTDAGCNLTYFMQSFITQKKQRIISAWGNSPMGYSVAAGIGAKFAEKKKQVISFIGDGSFLMNLQELNFIKHNKINLKIVIMDNKVYGNTKIGAKVYKVKNVGNDKSGGYFAPDIKKISKSFDIKYIYLKNNQHQENKIKKFLKTNKHAILHININPNHPLLEFTI